MKIKYFPLTVVPAPCVTDFGVEKSTTLEGMDEKAVEKEIAAMLK